MADRAQVRTDIESLLRHMGRREQSSIHLIWAWFGSGKTHTLKYLCHLSREASPAIETSYIEFPKSAKSFLDLYKTFAEELDFLRLQERLTDLFTTPGLENTILKLQTSFPDLERAVRSIVTGTSDQRILAIRWLKADNIPIRDLRSIGISQRLDTSQAAVKIISWLSNIIGTLSRGEVPLGRLVWVIDEFQLIQACRPSAAQEISGSLHSLFNRTPIHLSLFLSFSGKPEKKFPPWLSRELTDRIGIEKVILLPPLTNDEAVTFIRELLSHFRSPAENPPTLFPFEETTVHETLRLLHEKRVELKPRILMQTFSALLEEAEPLLESGELSCVDPGFVRKTLQERVFYSE